MFDFEGTESFSYSLFEKRENLFFFFFWFWCDLTGMINGVW